MTPDLPEFSRSWLEKFGPILAESSGHLWFRWKNDKFLSCRLCGMARREDGRDPPCPGRVRTELRQVFQNASTS